MYAKRLKGIFASIMHNYMDTGTYQIMYASPPRGVSTVKNILGRATPRDWSLWGSLRGIGSLGEPIKRVFETEALHGKT
jgi:hypothetical protein